MTGIPQPSGWRRSQAQGLAATRTPGSVGTVRLRVVLSLINPSRAQSKCWQSNLSEWSRPAVDRDGLTILLSGASGLNNLNKMKLKPNSGRSHVRIAASAGLSDLTFRKFPPCPEICRVHAGEMYVEAPDGGARIELEKAFLTGKFA